MRASKARCCCFDTCARLMLRLRAKINLSLRANQKNSLSSPMIVTLAILGHLSNRSREQTTNFTTMKGLKTRNWKIANSYPNFFGRLEKNIIKKVVYFEKKNETILARKFTKEKKQRGNPFVIFFEFF